jgi:flagellin-like hook-associated protein FlgL
MRIGTHSTFARVLAGIRRNYADLLRAQAQLTTGLRILRPSDDPAGAARSIQLERGLSEVARFQRTAAAGRDGVEGAASSLVDGSTLLSEARELVLQGMNGTLSAEDRRALAEEVDLIRSQMLELANRELSGRYLFGGIESDRPPFEEVTIGGRTLVVYRGSDRSGSVLAGEGVEIELAPPGSELFARFAPSVTRFAGLTGVASGLTADEGTGSTELLFRHTSTDPGALASVGIALANGGADDTLLGANVLTIDPVAGTIQLGSGPAVALPAAGSPAASDFVVENALGGELHLDLTGYTGVAFTGTVVGNGSVSFAGGAEVALSFAETDLELSDPATGAIVHLDTTGVARAGSELVTFGGRTNVFDVLAGIAEDLRNGAGLEPSDQLARLNGRLADLDRHAEDLRVGIGILGSRSQRLQVSGQRAGDVEVQLLAQLSGVRDADTAEVALDLARADQILQVAQASGVRLIQTSLLNFLG